MSRSAHKLLLNLNNKSGESRFINLQGINSDQDSVDSKYSVERVVTVLIQLYDELSPFGLLAMSKKLLSNPVKIVQILAIVTVISCLSLSVSAREKRSQSSYAVDTSSDEEDDLLSCPFECDCKGLTVDCANRGLKFVPKNIPTDAKRV